MAYQDSPVREMTPGAVASLEQAGVRKLGTS